MHASSQALEAPFGDSFLDRAVAASHRLRLFGRSYHPYHLASDLGLLSVLVLGWFHCHHVAGLDFPRLLVALAAMEVGYAGFRWLKARHLGMSSRSFLQDTLLFILPAWLLFNALVGNSVLAALDFAGLALPLGLSWIRVGCFLGGCCYGAPWRRGVHYPAYLLRAVDGWRSYRPGVPPGHRVLPMPLFEAAFNALFCAVLVPWTWRSGDATGHVLPAYLAGYGSWRIVSDFWRRSSVRPARAGLSEAQWVSIAVVIASAAVLW